MSGPLRLEVKNSIVHLQRKEGSNRCLAGQVPTLCIDLRLGKVQVLDAAPLSDSSPVVLGVIGLLNLSGGSVIVLASKATKVRMHASMHR